MELNRSANEVAFKDSKFWLCGYWECFGMGYMKVLGGLVLAAFLYGLVPQNTFGWIIQGTFGYGTARYRFDTEEYSMG
jgi:hypothetical protein